MPKNNMQKKGTVVVIISVERALGLGGSGGAVTTRVTVATALQQKIIINFPAVAYFCAAASLFITSMFLLLAELTSQTQECAAICYVYWPISQQETHC